MHYCLLVFSENMLSERELEDKLMPFNEDRYYGLVDYDENEEPIGELPPHPAFLWDWFEIGGRYNSILKWDFSKHYTQAKYPEKTSIWELSTTISPRNNRLFLSTHLTDIRNHYRNPRAYYVYGEAEAEMKLFPMMGSRDGYLRVDACPVSELHDSYEKCGFCFVGIDGSASAREYWNGSNWVDNENFDDQLAEQFEKDKNGWVTVVDIHD